MAQFTVDTLDHNLHQVTRSVKRFGNFLEAQNFAKKLADMQILAAEIKGKTLKLQHTESGFRAGNMEFIAVEL